MAEIDRNFRQNTLNYITGKLEANPIQGLDPYLLQLASDMIELPVDDWWKPFMQSLRNLPQEFQIQGEEVKNIVTATLRTPGLIPEHRFLATIQATADHFQIPGPYESLSNHDVRRIPLSDILDKHPEIQSQGLENLPPGICIKGGGARTALKLAAGATQDLVDTELPLTDIDYVVTNLSALPELAETEDIINVELKPGVSPEELISKADITMNCCVLTDTELLFSSEAMEAARTGHVASNYHNQRGFYGEDFVIRDGIVYPKPMNVFRLMKLVAEKRAYSFDFPINAPEGLDNNWLGIYRRYQNHPNFLTIGQRYFELARRMRIPTYGDDFMDTVSEVFKEHPRYPMSGGGPSDQAYYLLGKLERHIHDFHLRDMDAHMQEVELPQMRRVFLPPKIDENIDLELLSYKRQIFQERLRK